ncbi:DUF3667 domain-containing protein [Undibacterium sp. TJN19]|uniref:DUF3667 domain-containing protein n=1 Tax=Undibacterium sp. TJN19 TaxID=3413055 RepID=UPI003BF10D03
MNLDIEVATDVIAEAVVVNEIEKSGSHAAQPDEAHHACANCGTQLQGAYCHGCGQSAHIHRSIFHMAEELLHGLLHFETKAWRTIPALIFTPGKLTRNYIQGQRTRYVSPLALFLFLIFLMFFVFSMTGSGNISNSFSDKAHTSTGIGKELEDTRKKLASMQAERAKLPAGDPLLESNNEDIKELENEITALELALKLAKTKEEDIKSGKTEKTEEAKETDDKVTVTSDTSITDELASRLDKKFDDKNFHTTAPNNLVAKIRHALKNPELTLYKMKGNASKFAFMLMPISLPFLWLMFVFKRKYVMFDHAVFSLYSLSFMALLLMAMAILNKFDFTKSAVLLLVFIPPIHMFSQLKQAYQLGIWGSLWRTFAMLFVATCSLSVYALMVIGLSV